MPTKKIPSSTAPLLAGYLTEDEYAAEIEHADRAVFAKEEVSGVRVGIKYAVVAQSREHETADRGGLPAARIVRK